jgi:hypothetical protein
MDGIAAYQFRNGRFRRRLRIDEQADSSPFEKGNAPAIRMNVGGAAALSETGKGKADIGRNVAVHAE